MKPTSSKRALQSTAARSLFLLLAASGVASAKTVTAQYVRFHPLKLRSSTTLVQLSEFKFYNGSTTALPTTGWTVTDSNNVTAPTATSETPEKVIDNLTTTKWLDGNYKISELVFNFGAPLTFDSYNFMTGNDATDRDPVSWTIETSNNPDVDGWTVVDTIVDSTISTTRQAVANATNYVIPTTPKPYVVEFGFAVQSQFFIVKNGPTDFYAQTALATSATITNNVNSTVVNVPASPNDGQVVTITPPNNSNTTFTLNAISAAGTRSQTLFVRSASGATQNYRYIRYTPTQLRGGGNAIQMSDFSFYNGGVKVPVTTVTTTAPVQTNEEVTKLIDTDTTTFTKWFSGTKAPVLFDFGAPTNIDSYSFSTANDFNDRDPVKWTLEGSNDNATWTLIENMTDITFPTTTVRNTASAVIPITGTPAPSVTLSASSATILPGDSVTLTYATTGAASYSISQGVTTATPSGTATVSPTQTTTYTLTAYSGANNTGLSASTSVTVTVASQLTGVINYPNFNTAPEIATVGSATIVNDFANFPAGGDVKRLRLTPSSGSQTGAAWSFLPVKLTDGFETTFTMEPSNSAYYNGADGMAFIIQNTTDKYRANPNGSLYFPANAVSVVLDSYKNGADTVNGIPADLSYASLQVFNGKTQLANVDLSKTTGNGLAKGYTGDYLTIYPSGAQNPYLVHITYAAGKMSITLDGTPVVTDLAIDLSTAGAVDASGNGYVGFAARTGGLYEYHDVDSWTLTPTTVTVTNPLAITSSSFSFTSATAGTLNLTWTSNSGKTYKITESTDLVTWTQVGSNIPSAGSTTTSGSVSFTRGTKDFYRVEEVTTP